MFRLFFASKCTVELFEDKKRRYSGSVLPSSFFHLLLLTGCKSNPVQIPTWHLSNRYLDEDVPGKSSRNVAGSGLGCSA